MIVGVMRVCPVDVLYSGYHEWMLVDRVALLRSIANIVEYGFTAPIRITRAGRIVDGLAIFAAAVWLGKSNVPVIVEGDDMARVVVIRDFEVNGVKHAAGEVFTAPDDLAAEWLAGGLVNVESVGDDDDEGDEGDDE